MARAERMLTDDAIADEVATYNELIPESGRAVGHAVHRAHRRRSCCANGCRSCATSSSTCTSISGRAGAASRVAGRPARRGAAHARRHHVDRALPAASRSTPSSGTLFAAGPGADRRRPSRVHRCGWSSTTRSAPSSPATSRTDAGADPGPAARPGAAAAAPAAHRRRRLRPPRPRAASSSRRGAARARAHRARGRDPVGLRRVRAAPLRPRAQARHHLPEHARAHRSAVPRRAQGAAREHRPRAAVSPSSAATASRSS